jgi:hypothetical protein
LNYVVCQLSKKRRPISASGLQSLHPAFADTALPENQLMKRVVTLLLAFVFLSYGNLAFPQTFRGIPMDQGFNQHSSPVFGGEWFVDLKDTFSDDSRDLQLRNSRVDDILIGFVPPTYPIPAAEAFGHWMGSQDYVVDTTNGKVKRLGSQTGEVVCNPWRVTPELGDYYLIELTAAVAEGESVRLGYFGNVATYGTELGLLHSGLGQLVLDVTRGEGVDANTITWTVNSAMLDNPISNVLNITSPGELRLQLGWNEDDNLFDAWLESAEGNSQLSAGALNGALDVFGVGMELTGSVSHVSNFVAAVPEPNSILLVAIGGLVLINTARRARFTNN